jgi:hypothetical protein
MSLNDAPVLPLVTSLTGAERFAVVKPTGLEIGVKVNALHGVLSGDVDSDVADSAAITTRVSLGSGTTPSISLPSVSGDLREVYFLNGASGSATLTTPGSEKIYTATAEADTLVVATGKTAHLLSDGTRWYHVSNDA